MAIASNNTIQTNYQTELVALRGAESAAYFTVGSKAHIQDSELVGKRNGQTYGFVIRDRGEVENSLSISQDAKKNIVERTVNLTIEPWHVYEENNVVEGKTDLQFDKEVAEMDGPALIQKAVKKYVQNDVPKSATCFIGKAGEFEPLAVASGYLQSVTIEPLYGFCDPQIQSLVTSRGAAFVPQDTPPMYKQGAIGIFHGADYHSQRFIPRVIVSKTFADAMVGATFASFNATTNKLTVTLGATPASAFTISAGTPFWVEGIVACDLIGDETTEPYAFICKSKVNVAGDATAVEIPVDEVPVAFGGTRVAANEDGSEVKWAEVSTSASVTIPETGKYMGAIIRANGAYNFQTLNDIDVKTPESTKGSVQGLTVFQNRMTDMNNFVTGTRFDTFTLAGTVEKRAQSLVLVKAK